MEPRIYLKPGRERSIFNHHPWVFSGAVSRVEGSPQSGNTVEICTSHNECVALAAYNPSSQIVARVWTWDPSESVNEAFFVSRIKQAIQLRKGLVEPHLTNSYRLIFAESDGLPGLIADKYADVIVLQILTAGAERWKETFCHILMDQLKPISIYERSDVEVRRLEGLVEKCGLLSGAPIDGGVLIRENGLTFEVDPVKGQKTGFYLDQRENRLRLLKYVKGMRVLNCFSFTGGFSVYAIKGGAREVTSIDSSEDALLMGRRNLAHNLMEDADAFWLEGDVFEELRKCRDRNHSYDVIILDPPKFAPTAALVEKASRAYKDINLLAFKLLNPGGILFTFSCSGGVSSDLFLKIVSGAAVDAGANIQLLETMMQAPDHPIVLNYPESAYLKGLVCLKKY